MDDKWLSLIDIESKKDYYKNLKSFVMQEYQVYTVFPEYKNIFKAFDLTNFDNVKVVILGQDPYHNVGQAQGLAFSVPEGFVLPPSLVNIYKEIKNDIGSVTYDKGDLSMWGKQGVLLLNAILTVRAHHPLSHQNQGWEIFTDEILKKLNDDNSPKVFLLWGAYARSKKKYITNPIHLVLEAPHPSPLSAYSGFFGCKHFSQANEFLRKNNLKEIIW